MSKDLNNIFEKLHQRYFTAVERDYKNRLKRAKDKEFVFKELQKGVEFALDMSSAEPKKKEFIEVFENHYKRGETIEYIFNLLRKSYGEGEAIASFKLKSIEDGKEVTPYISEEEKALKKLSLNERAFSKFFIRYLANNEMKTRLPKIFEEFSEVKNQAQGIYSAGYEIKWTGSKENKNEFVQIIYALHEAKRINNGKGEITKIVEGLAQAFNIKLGNNWQGNHSNSIHKRRAKYEPPIFQEMEDAYKEYEYNLVEAKKSRQ